MKHRDKLKQVQAHVASLGMPRNAWQPPLWRLLWRLGIEAPPPVFWGFGSLALLFGSFFGVLWGTLMWLFVWPDQGMSFPARAIGIVVVALLFGTFMAAYFRYFARKYDLPSWSEYKGISS